MNPEKHIIQLFRILGRFRQYNVMNNYSKFTALIFAEDHSFVDENTSDFYINEVIDFDNTLCITVFTSSLRCFIVPIDGAYLHQRIFYLQVC